LRWREFLALEDGEVALMEIGVCCLAKRTLDAEALELIEQEGGAFAALFA
jgi:hypothetical protein